MDRRNVPRGTWAGVKEMNFAKENSFSNSVATDTLNDYQFQLYVGFVMYATMLLTGEYWLDSFPVTSTDWSICCSQSQYFSS